MSEKIIVALDHSAMSQLYFSTYFCTFASEQLFRWTKTSATFLVNKVVWIQFKEVINWGYKSPVGHVFCFQHQMTIYYSVKFSFCEILWQTTWCFSAKILVSKTKIWWNLRSSFNFLNHKFFTIQSSLLAMGEKKIAVSR